MKLVALTIFLCGQSVFAGSSDLDSALTRREAPSSEKYYSSYNSSLSEEEHKKADAMRAKTISSIETLLRGKKLSPPKRFELFRRMGEIHIERHDYLREQEIADFHRRYDLWVDAGQKGKEPVIDQTASRGELAKSANAFRKLVSEFPKHSRADYAVFTLAKTLSRLGNDNAVLYFNRFLRDFPKSKLVPEAHLALAEYYFESGSNGKAIKHYKSVAKYKKEKIYPYAIYKLAWAYYNAKGNNPAEQEKNIRKTIVAFKLVISLSEKQKTKFGTIELRKESLKDLLMVWADTGNIEDSYAYLKKIKEEKSFYELLERVAAGMQAKGNYDKAEALYKRIIAEQPNKTSIPAIRARLVEISEKRGETAKLVSGFEAWGQLLFTESSWLKANQSNKNLLAEAKGRLESSLHRFSTVYHDRGQKAKNRGFLEVSKRLYELYLSHYPKGSAAYTLRYYLADIEYDLGNYTLAAQYYITVAEGDGAQKEAAALNAVVSLGEALAKKPSKKTKLLLVKAYDRYGRMFPKGEKTPKMHLAAAQTLSEMGKPVGRRLKVIIQNYPKSPEAAQAMGLEINRYVKKKDWKAIAKFTKYFRTHKEVQTKKLKTTFDNLLIFALIEKAKHYDGEKQHANAAAAYQEIYKEFPRDKEADIFLFNAAQNYFKSGQIDKGITTYTTILEKFPKSALRADVFSDLAQAHEALANFKQAATYYEMMVTRYPNDQRSPGALYNAAFLNLGLKKYNSAVKLFTALEKSYPNRKDLLRNTYLNLAKIYERNLKDYALASKYYQNYLLVADSDRLWAQAKALEIQSRRDGRYRGLTALERELSKTNPTEHPRAKGILASVMLKKLEPEFRRVRNLKVSDPRKAESQIKSKQKGLEYLATNFRRIIKVGSPEYVVASLYKLGEIHENFAESLFAAPAPTGKTEMEVLSYKSEMEKLAFPLREQAYEFYRRAYESSSQIQVFSDWTSRTYQKMAKLNPGKHNEILEKNADPVYTAHQLVGVNR